MSRLAALIYKFLDERSELHYRKVLDLIKLEFPKAISAEDIQAIEDGILRVENGAMPITINDKEHTAKEIFKTIAEAGYFERRDEAQNFLKEIAKMPLVHRLFWFQFKNYIFEAFRIISFIFDVIQAIESKEEYKDKFKPEDSNIKKCIYCLSETGDFNTEEHIFSESLAGDEIYLPKGFVCDICNNGISSQLDNALINFEPIAFLRVQFTPYTKAGKFPKANFHNMVLEKTDPNHIRITAKDKTGRPQNERTLPDGQVAFNLTWKGKKLEWKLYARAIYKIALGFVAYDMGHEAALDERYHSARDFILKGKTFNNNMLVSTKSKPHPSIRSHCNMQSGGTPFFIDIFGMMFFINLEELPVLEKNESINEFLAVISEHYQFELISLKK